MDQDQEINLYQKVKGDDRRALTQLFTVYYSSLCNFALPIVKKPELAEELVADVFFVLWRDRHHLDITYSVKAYLFRAVRNRALRIVSGKNAIHEEIENYSTPMVLNHTPESDYLYKELSTAYQKAYDSLPTRCKQVFKLSKIDGLKYQEISYVLNISVKTVENQMFKALKVIRQAISNYRMEKLP